MRAAAVLAAAFVCACTQEFDAFHVVQGSDASGGSAGSGTGGSAGSGTGGSGGATDTSAGSGGSADSSADGSGGDADASPDIVCPAGEKPCAGGCVSATDPLTGCASTSCAPCNRTNAAAVCDAAGQCAIGTCAAGFEDCDNDAATGCESATATDADHCGACGRACAGANTLARVCENGVCTSTCQQGFGNCSQPSAPETDDGCETSTSGNIEHCGACNRPCLANNSVITPLCSAGVCTSTCRAGFSNCVTPAGTTADDGCETDTDTDPDHCGACGYACGAQNVTTRECVAGECTPTCALGFASCNATRPALDDGCETNIASDVINCGGCGRACSATMVLSRSCTGGVCDSTCLLGFGNCSMPLFPTQDNGCELGVSQNSTNCGGCGNSCTAQNGLVCGQDSSNFCGCNGTNARCRSGNSGGACLTSGLCSCPTGSGSAVACRPGEYCQSAVAGGSECTCNGGTACAAGQTCCETPAGCFNTSTDAANCGACGRACPTGFACASGLCRCATASSCAAGTTGTFACDASGFCVCNGTTCTAGRRCQPNGQCG